MGIYFFVVIFTFSSCSQQGVDSYDNKLNEKYIIVPGTRISLIPPDGFKIKNLAPQLVEENGNGQIAIVEAPESYYKIMTMYTPEAYKKVPNEELINTKAIKINGYEGTELFIRLSNQMKYMLMFGNEHFCVAIGCSYFKEYESTLSGKIRKSVLTLVYDPQKRIDPIKNLPYEISIIGTKLKLAGATQSFSFYSVDGKSPTQDPDKTYLEIGGVQGKSLTEDQIQKLIKDVMKYEGKSGLEDIKSTKVLIDGMNGYETFGYITVGNDTIKVIYTVILYNNNEIYTISGLSNMDFNENIYLFRKISKTFKRKQSN